MNACAPVINESLTAISYADIQTELEAVNAAARVVKGVADACFNATKEESCRGANSLLVGSVIVIGALALGVPYLTEQIILFLKECGRDDDEGLHGIGLKDSGYVKFEGTLSL